MWWKLFTLTTTSFLIANFPFLPMRPAIMAIYFAKDINFLLVTLACAIGTTLGAIPVYGATYKATDFEKFKQWMNKKWVKKFLLSMKNNLFLVIVLINLTPIPDPFVGILGGLEKYDFKKFLLANFVSRIIFYLPFALIGYYFAGDISTFENWLMDYFKTLIG